MAKRQLLTAPIASEKMPAGVPYILTNEAAERFAFYGSRCILVYFMTHLLRSAEGHLDLMTPEQSKTWFHLFVSAVYFTPLIGALISDIWLGKYRTIFWFSILYCVGFFTLAADHTRLGLVVGLGLIAIGSGVIKPCVSANVGDQFGTTNKHLMNRIYNWFYFAINLGAAIGNALVPELLGPYGPTVAFGVPLALMVLATFVFWLGRERFVHIPRAGVGFVRECLSGEGLRALGRLAVIYALVAPFWALFDQMDSAWVLLAEKMNRQWLWHDWKSSQIVVANPVLILVLIPAFSYVIYPAINRVFKLTPLRKIGIGLLVMTLPFIVAAAIESRIATGIKPSVAWLFLAYIFLTSAEVMVSITCLEFSYTQAPRKMKSFIMAVFFLSITLGNAFTAAVNVFIQNPDGTSKLPGASYYWFFVGVMAVTAVLFIPVANLYKPKEYIQDESPTGT